MNAKEEIEQQNERGYAVGKNIILGFRKFLSDHIKAMARNSFEKDKWSAYSMGFETGLAEQLKERKLQLKLEKEKQTKTKSQARNR